MTIQQKHNLNFIQTLCLVFMLGLSLSLLGNIKNTAWSTDLFQSAPQEQVDSANSSTLTLSDYLTYEQKITALFVTTASLFALLFNPSWRQKTSQIALQKWRIQQLIRQHFYHLLFKRLNNIRHYHTTSL